MTDNATLVGELGRSRRQLLDALALVPDEAWQPEGYHSGKILKLVRPTKETIL